MAFSFGSCDPTAVREETALVSRIVCGAVSCAPGLDGLIVDRVADGMVHERWEQWDQSLMPQQLGLA